MFLAKSGRAVPLLKISGDLEAAEEEQHIEHVEPPKLPPVSTTITTTVPAKGPPVCISALNESPYTETCFL